MIAEDLGASLGSNSTTAVQLSIPPCEDCFGLARLVLSGVCSATSIGVDEVADLKLALTEAAHCFTGDEGSVIHLSFELKRSSLVVKLWGGRRNDLGAAVSGSILDTLTDEWGHDHRVLWLVKHLDCRVSNE